MQGNRGLNLHSPLDGDFSNLIDVYLAVDFISDDSFCPEPIAHGLRDCLLLAEQELAALNRNRVVLCASSAMRSDRDSTTAGFELS
jgi:hypothetical protein